MARKLADLIHPDPVVRSVSVVDASGVRHADLQREAERRFDERIQRESEGLSVTYDPSLFQWHSSRMFSVHGPKVTIRKDVIRIMGIAEVEQWLGKPVEIGLAPKSLAFRVSSTGFGWKLYREKNITSPRFRLVMPTRLRFELERRGWPFNVTCDAVWDDNHQMIVVPMPADQDDGKRERRRKP